MMDGGSEPRQRVEMLGHAVAHVALEAVAGMSRPSRVISRSRVTLATIEAAAIEAMMASPLITAWQSQPTSMRSRPSTKTSCGLHRQRRDRARQRPQRARRILSRSMRAGGAKATATSALAQILA